MSLLGTFQFTLHDGQRHPRWKDLFSGIVSMTIDFDFPPLNGFVDLPVACSRHLNKDRADDTLAAKIRLPYILEIENPYTF